MQTNAPPIESIWSFSELRAHVGLPLEGAITPDRLSEGTPPDLLGIVHYAAAWGISDDGYRSDLLSAVGTAARKNLQWVVRQYDDPLDGWLAGPDSTGARFSEAYVAFSCMRMAADEAQAATLGPLHRPSDGPPPSSGEDLL